VFDLESEQQFGVTSSSPGWTELGHNTGLSRIPFFGILYLIRELAVRLGSVDRYVSKRMRRWKRSLIFGSGHRGWADQ
jgi:hypothetical protein